MKHPRRVLPHIRWELISCGLHGHFLVGTDVSKIRAEDAVFAREADGLRLYRCLRCSAWILKRPPKRAPREFAPGKSEIELPIRGHLLRDRYVLRLIAFDRAIHVLFLGLFAVLIFLFATHQSGLRNLYLQIFQGFQGVNSDLGFNHFLTWIGGIFDFKKIHVIEVGLVVSVLALIEAVEMVGLWQGRRWAEYLTFIATILFIPYEVFELVHGVSVIKVIAFVINLGIAAYLLYAKRLFGIHGGSKGEAREKRQDSGWAWLERTSPKA